MKERPVIFNGEMVRAIIDGRKTQTRRVMKVQPSEHFHPMNMALELDYSARWYTPGVVDKDGYLQPAKNQIFGVAGEDEGYACPFGAVGELLWVRETFMDLTGTGIEATTGKFEGFAYRADTPAGSYGDEVRKEYGLKWTPSLHMPRKACRILLEITAVRVEHLNDISEEDARAEGVAPSQHIITPPEALYRVGFLKLWQSIYGEESWGANPWVWVIEFRRVGDSAREVGRD
ncbi:hypothetical protein ACI2JW_18165 [Serratia ureilytica]|uniref:hypothetical protein n=1 Tax=Serratia ureilytica TaxID=300181 RepID=UPI00384AF7F8